MSVNLKGALKVSGAYTAAVIGAGFASGREIVTYFARYGRWGFWGVIVACFGFSLFVYSVLAVCRKFGFSSYSQYIDYAAGKNVLGKAFKAVICAASAISMATMIACAGEIGDITLHAPKIIISVIFAFVSGFILLMNNRKIENVNAVLGVLIAAGVIFVCLYILRFREHQTMAVYHNAALSGISYAGYNIVGTGAILSGMSGEMKDKNDVISASLASGLILFLVISLMYGVLSIYYGKINLGHLPMMTLALRDGKSLGVLYGIILTAAVLTTSLSSGYALIDMLLPLRNNGRNRIIMILAALVISGMGFGVLVDTVYRFLGYVGAMLALMMIILTLMKNEDK